MKANKHIYELFTKSGCLSMKGIGLYILKQLDEVSIKSVQDHIKSCDLCKDAIEGIQSTKNIKSFEISVKQINSEIGALLNEHVTSKKDIIVKRYRFISIAASIALLIGMFFILNIKNKLQDLTHNMLSEKNIRLVFDQYEVIRPSPPRISPLNNDREKLPLSETFLDKEEQVPPSSLLLIKDFKNNSIETISYEAFRNIDYSAVSTESMSGENKIIQIVFSRQGKLKEIHIVTDPNHLRNKALVTVISSQKKVLEVNKRELLRKSHSFPVQVIRQ